MSVAADEAAERPGWVSAWPDALAFVGGLALAWYAGWDTTDLVWSLWLSSLGVGYAVIVWSVFSPALRLQREGSAGAAVAALIGGVFMLAFFTVHFGMFHLVHSVFLNLFFPVGPKVAGLFNFELYAEVVRRYWYFLPLALLAERLPFRLAPLPPAPPPTSVKAADIDARKARNALSSPASSVAGPYKNVVRLHLLIFFFAGAHFLKLDSFLVYAVVYAVYFFPWRLLGGAKTVASG